MDASQDPTDVESVGYLEPLADGFRNYRKNKGNAVTEALLIDKAQLLTLPAPELTVLVGGMRTLNTHFDGSKHGVFTQPPGQLANDSFVYLLDMNTAWKAMDNNKDLSLGSDRTTGQPKWTATLADLVFGSHFK